jgi:hypothetical protein
MADTYNMNTPQDITPAERCMIDDLQVRSLAYTLMRKYDNHFSPSEVLATALRWAELLGMAEWQGYEAQRAWSELTYGKDSE